MIRRGSGHPAGSLRRQGAGGSARANLPGSHPLRMPAQNSAPPRQGGEIYRAEGLWQAGFRAVPNHPSTGPVGHRAAGRPAPGRQGFMVTLKVPALAGPRILSASGGPPRLWRARRRSAGRGLTARGRAAAPADRSDGTPSAEGHPSARRSCQGGIAPTQDGPQDGPERRPPEARP
jgi:hypothetical protein